MEDPAQPRPKYGDCGGRRKRLHARFRADLLTARVRARRRRRADRLGRSYDRNLAGLLYERLHRLAYGRPAGNGDIEPGRVKRLAVEQPAPQGPHLHSADRRAPGRPRTRLFKLCGELKEYPFLAERRRAVDPPRNALAVAVE